MLPYEQVSPHVEEAQVLAQTLTVAAGDTEATADIACGHAKRIDVALEATTNDIEVTVLMYGASKNIVIETVLGVVVAGSGTAWVYGATEYMGQSYIIQVLNTDGQSTAADATYDLHTIARP